MHNPTPDYKTQKKKKKKTPPAKKFLQSGGLGLAGLLISSVMPDGKN